MGESISQPCIRATERTRWGIWERIKALLKDLGRKARTARFNASNTFVYVLTLGGRTLHEGGFSWLSRCRHNWNGLVTFKPAKFALPRTQQELQTLLGASQKVRMTGAGHAFNASIETDDLLISLDEYTLFDEATPDRAEQVVVDVERRRVRVQAGFRLRDLNKVLASHGLALPVLGSTDAQSIGGLLATDLHGTGKSYGFLSERVVELCIMDAQGRAKKFRPGSDVFHAAMGGLGTCGIITEVELECVPAFTLAKSSWLVERGELEASLEDLLLAHDHVSLYFLAGASAEHVIVNVWDHTDRPPSPLLRWRKVWAECGDMLMSGFLLGFGEYKWCRKFIAWLGFLLFKLFNHGRQRIHPAATGFSRKLFYRHDELEYGVPHDGLTCVNKVLALLDEEHFLTIVEVRFTPDTSQALLGPGVGRRTCHIELAPSTYHSPERTQDVFQKVERLLLKHGGQPHLGKRVYVHSHALAAIYTSTWRSQDETRFERFQAVRRRQDPTGRFTNPFIEQIF